MTDKHKYKAYPEKSHYYGTCEHCGMMEELHDDENDNGDVNKENVRIVTATEGTESSWRPLYQTPTPLPPVANTNDIFVPLKFGNGTVHKKVPDSYGDLYNLTVDKSYSKLSPRYFNWGAERYNVGSKEYQEETKWGMVNSCYLPGTDTIKDVEEELLDAYFNCLVLLWKNPDNTDAKVMQTLISQALFVCEESRGANG